MNEAMIAQVFAVLDKYNKSYSRDGVVKNLSQWERNKGTLVALLRRHPNWNVEALAVIFEVTQSREIDRCVVNAHSNYLFQLSRDMDMSNEDATNLSYSLNTAIGPYAKLLPDEQVASSIKAYSGISCVAGQKASRVIHKICQRYGLDKHPEYNARFAPLADSLNPMQVKRKALLSVHPCDYLEMSNEDNSWSSCHCIREGEYHAGTLSYMNDGVSMIFYTVDEGADGAYHKEPKITRQVFCYGDGILLQSRIYPNTDDDEARNIYRDIVQRTLSRSLGLPNLWKLHRKQEHVERHSYTHGDALQYTDYIYQSYKPNISLLNTASMESAPRIVIGDTAYCIDCSCKLYRNDTLHCESCNSDAEYITCEDCGERIERDSDDDYNVNGSHYCRDCVSYCERCQDYTRGEMTCVTNHDGFCISVCEYCREEYYDYCVDCGRYYERSTGEELEDGCRCQSCLERHYLLCDRCGDYVRCEDSAEIDEHLYCPDCAEVIDSEMEEIREGCFATA